MRFDSLGLDTCLLGLDALRIRLPKGKLKSFSESQRALQKPGLPPAPSLLLPLPGRSTRPQVWCLKELFVVDVGQQPELGTLVISTNAGAAQHCWWMAGTLCPGHL